MIVSFQPEKLASIASTSFTGEEKPTAAQFDAILEKVIAGQGYSDRKFRQSVELNLRPAYENIGMYRVRFPAISAPKPDQSSVAVAVTIEEGVQFALGSVQM